MTAEPGPAQFAQNIRAKLANPAGGTTSTIISQWSHSRPREEIRAHFSASHPGAARLIHCKLPCRRPARELANGGPLERWAVAQSVGTSGCADPDLCRAYGALARDLRRPHLDRRQGARRIALQPL